MDFLGIEVAPGYIVLALVWFSSFLTLAFLAIRGAKRVQARLDATESRAFEKVDQMAARYEAKLESILTRGEPMFAKVEAALDNLPSLDPGKLAVAFEPMLVSLFDQRVGPWASKMGNDLLGQLDARIAHVEAKLGPVTSIAAKVMGSHGGDAKAVKVRNREVADNIRARIPAGLLSLLPKNLKMTEDATELLDGLLQFKPLADRFAPGLLDSFIGGMVNGEAAPAAGGGGIASILGMPGITPSKEATGATGVGKASYMTE